MSALTLDRKTITKKIHLDLNNSDSLTNSNPEATEKVEQGTTSDFNENPAITNRHQATNTSESYSGPCNDDEELEPWNKTGAVWGECQHCSAGGVCAFRSSAQYSWLF